jgi:tRNA 2-thiouridine synthesizing protein E
MSETQIYRYLNDDKTIPLDAEGYLVNREEWSAEVAKSLAAEEDIALTPEHWELIQVLRDFYTKYEMAPAMRAWVKAVKQHLGEEKGKSIYLMSLFPGSPAKRAAKIAGLPKPTNCL